MMYSTPDKEVYRAKCKVASANRQNSCTCLNLDGYSLINLPSLLFTSTISSTLTELNISFNKLTVLPDALSMLQNLQYLSAQGNQLTCINSCLLTIKCLKNLDLSRNCICVIPEWLGNMEQLKFLNLSGNNISTFNRAVLLAPSLKSLFLTRNPICNISADFYLQSVNFLRNHFHIVPPVICEKDSPISIKCNDLYLDKPSCISGSEENHISTLSNSNFVMDIDPKLEVNIDHKCVHYSSDSDADIAEFQGNNNFDHSEVHHKINKSEQGRTESSLTSILADDVDKSDHFDSFSSYRLSILNCTEEMNAFDTNSKGCIVQSKNVRLHVPPHNLSGFIDSDFDLTILNNNTQFDPTLTDNASLFSLCSLISPIVHAGPHGARFLLSQPAKIFLPLNPKHLQSCLENIVCLVSDTDIDESPIWNVIPSTDCVYDPILNSMIISTVHFSIFCAVIKTSYPTNKIWIPPNNDVNKEVIVPECPGVVIDIPPGAVQGNSVVVSVKVLYADEVYSQSEDNVHPVKALATPIIMLEPHQQEFCQPVEITLPLPDYEKIRDHFHSVDLTSQLTIHHSDTALSERPSWRPLTPEEAYSLRVWSRTDSSGVEEYQVSFLVTRFCFFRGVWTWLANSMYEAKIGASYLYQQVSFNMMCHALMRDEPESSSFGLNIVLFHSENPLPRVGNFPRFVGGSTRSKAILPGPIRVRVVSSNFCADTAAGEDVSLSKVETEFRGREFDKQFACRLIDGDRLSGVLGKVIVERVLSPTSAETIFEFNLTKNERNSTSSYETDNGAVESMLKLAEEYHATEDRVWSRLLRQLGFNRQEMRHLNSASDSLQAMIFKFQIRGGSLEEFTKALRRSGYRRSLACPSGRRLLPALVSPPSSSTLAEESWSCEDSINKVSLGCSRKRSHRLADLSTDCSSNSNLFQPIRKRVFKKRRQLCGYPRYTQRKKPVFLPIEYNHNTLKRTRDSEEVTDVDSSDMDRRHNKRHCRYTVTLPSTTFDEVDAGLVKRNTSALQEYLSNDQQHGTRLFPNAQQVACDGVTQDALFANSTRELTNKELCRLSYPLARFWKTLARDLELAEDDVYVIEHENMKDPRECMYQVFLHWREQWPERCQLGLLYKVLNEAGLKRVARTYFTTY